MIPVPEAILLLQTSAPTFYRRVKKKNINLVVQKTNSGRESFVEEEDFETLRIAMGKPKPPQQNSSSEVREPNEVKFEQDNGKQELINELEKQIRRFQSK